VKGVTHRRPCVLRPTSTPRLWRHRWMSVVTSNSQDQRADWRCGVGGVRRQDHHPHPCFSFIVSSSCVNIDVMRAFQRDPSKRARSLCTQYALSGSPTPPSSSAGPPCFAARIHCNEGRIRLRVHSCTRSASRDAAFVALAAHSHVRLWRLKHQWMVSLSLMEYFNTSALHPHHHTCEPLSLDACMHVLLATHNTRTHAYMLEYTQSFTRHVTGFRVPCALRSWLNNRLMSTYTVAPTEYALG
jgi:hypothetical protein